MEKRFKIGDEVVALNNPKNNLCQPRIKGKTYTVNSVIYCSGCGRQCINLGLSIPDNFGSNLKCSCGKTTPNLRLHWTRSKYFAKLDELDKELEEAIANEDYDTAIIIRDLNR